MNREQEQSLINLFKSRYNDFPVGELIHIDKPDFIVNSNVRVGIELTQIFKDQNHTDGSFLRKKQQFKTQILKGIVLKLKEIEYPTCVLDIDFNDRLFTGQENTRQLAQYCFDDILIRKDKISCEGNHVIYNNGAFSKWIESYSLYVSNQFLETEFVLTAGSVGEPLTNDRLQFILDKKEKAKADYQYCDEHWLVIFEGSFEADHFGKNQIEPDSLTTSFNKVFLLRQFENNPIIIKDDSC